MHVILLSETGRGGAFSAALRSIRHHHPDAPVTTVVTNPVAAGSTDVVHARDLAFGPVRYIDAWLAAGPVFARWCVVPAIAMAMDTDETLLVLPEHAWVTAPLDDLAAGVDAG